MPALTDDEILSICVQEIDNVSGQQGDLADDRTTAIKRYLGEPLGNEIEGRSQIVTREVLDTIEWVLPQLIRVFTDADTPVSFSPVGPEDEDAAQQDTDVVNHIFWEENEGYLNCYSWFKDALLTKTGILKVYWDDSETESRAEYEGLSDVQLAELLFDQSVEREVIEYEQTPEGHHVVFQVTSPGKVAIEPCPPEEFGVNDDMRTADVQKARMAYHRTLKTPSELLALGYKRDTVEGLPWSSGYASVNTTGLARRYLSDEQGLAQSHADWSLQTIWYTECYIRLDRDGDGMAELLRVCMATPSDTGAEGSQLLDVSEFDHIPFVCITPNIRTHAFYGLSVADIATDLQETNTALLRNLLDNIYFVNNKEKAYDDALVNPDDIAETKPGGGIRADTKDGRLAIGNILMPIQHQPLGADAYNLLEHLKGQLKSRTGVGDEVAALDPGKLANVNTGVAAIAYDAARAKIELVARNFAELGFRPLYRKLHELIRKHQDKPLTVKLRNQWVQVDPSDWRERTNMRINVGMGQASRERRMMALESVLQKQADAVQAGGFPAIVGPEHLYAALTDYTESLGLKDSERYWQDPKTYQPPPQQPSLEERVAHATFMVEQGKLQIQRERNQVDMLKAQGEERIAALRAQQQARESETRLAMQHLQGQLDLAKAQRDSSDSQIRLQAEFRQKMAERQLAEAGVMLKDQQVAHQRELDRHKADQDAAVKLAIAQLQADAAAAKAGGDGPAVDPQQIAVLLEAVQSMQAELDEDRRIRALPQDVTYEGDQIAAIGGKRVTRDENGRPQRIG